jgi:two-component system response regulator YesN
LWKVAIIDDDFQVIRGLKKAIPWERLELELVGEAIDGEAGLQLIEELGPDIVITDIYMPNMNGIEMIEQLKKRGVSSRFVILSGYNDFEYARTALRLGVDDYLTKPVTVEQIHNVLASVIGKLEEDLLQRLESSADRTAASLRKDEWLLAHLNGWSQDTEPPAVLGENGKFAVMVIEVVWTERIRSISLADWNLFKFAVSNITAEVAEQEWPASSFVWLFGNHAALLLQSPLAESDERILQAGQTLGQRMTDLMKSYLGLDVRIALGGIKLDWRKIRESGNEAMQSLFEMQPQPDGLERVSADQADVGADADELFLIDYFTSITKALQAGDDDEVMRLIRLYMRSRQPDQREEPLFYRVLAAEVWTLLHNALLTAGIAGKSEDEGLVMRELSSMTELVKIEEWLERQIAALRRQQSPVIHEKHRKAVQFMIEYVHAHYAEDITLEQLAAQLYISKNYLNQLFKKVTGETFTNYVIRVRIEKAKALLMDGSYLIYEVSEMVGYQNVPYFSTLFKKYCGVSPSELMKR